MTSIYKEVFHKFFRDKKGRILIWQFPNIPLWGWIVFTILAALIKHAKAHTGFHLLGQSFLFAWSFMEVSKGESIFRRVLGLVIFVYLIVSFFK